MTDVATLSGAVALAVALLGTPVAIRVAHARGWHSVPRADRWASRPVALMGGLAIVAAFFSGAATAGLFGQRDFALVLGVAAVISVLGLIDDRRLVDPAPKLVIEIVAAAVVIWTGEQLATDWPRLLSWPVTVLFVVGITNAVNLLDNMDGLAGGVVAVLCGGAALILGRSGDTSGAALAIAASGACLGFLAYNAPPARVYMGDCGSLALGFLTAYLALRVGRFGAGTVDPAWAWAVPVVLVALPIMDTTLVTLSRIRAGRSVAQGGRDHVSHRLVMSGLGERGAVGLLVVMAAASVGVVYAAQYSAAAFTMTAALLLLVLVALFVRLVLLDPYVAAPNPLPATVEPRSSPPRGAELPSGALAPYRAGAPPGWLERDHRDSTVDLGG